jgi:hypothetical protein
MFDWNENLVIRKTRREANLAKWRYGRVAKCRITWAIKGKAK